MTKILGQDGTGWTLTSTLDFANSAGALGFANGYVPLFNGNITSFNLAIGTSAVAATVQICLYLGASPSTGGATLIATSNAVVPVANSTINLPITPTAVSTSNTYTMFISCSSSSIATIFNSGASAFVDSQYNSTHFPFGAPPATTFNPRDSGTGHEPLLWADGNTGAPTNYTLVGQTGSYGYSGSQANIGYGLNGLVGVYSYTGIAAQLLYNGQPFGGGGTGYGKGRRRFHRYS